ncbi:MAG TPA: hypothetical protein V6C57_26975 [Coleofasciculaceae cyanobacterium]
MTVFKFRLTRSAGRTVLGAIAWGLLTATAAIAAGAGVPASPQVQATPKTQVNPSGSLTLAPGFSPDPQVSTGVSGGSRATTNCGYVGAADAPNQVISLTQPFSFLRASVEAEGDVTLLIETPSGKLLCSDDVNGLMPEIAGEAPPGIYKIWVGDYVGNAAKNFRYRLTLTEKSS